MGNSQEHIGQQIGDYRLQRQLGKGSFGTVYLAEHLHDHSHAAVKLLALQITSRNDLRDFLNEARTIRLRHPHIIPLLDFGLSRDDLPFLVMEYADEGTLRDRHPKGSKLPEATIDSYVQQLASALQYAHDRHLIHRDVKPENMLLRRDGTVLLSDFGIAKLIEQSSFENLHIQAGTPVYMAPEQSQGKPCPASDQYALAVVAYEWFSGSRLFHGGQLEVILQHRIDPPPSLRALRPDVSLPVEQTIFKALAKVPEERFPTVTHFAQALHTALQGDREPTQPIHTIPNTGVVNLNSIDLAPAQPTATPPSEVITRIGSPIVTPQSDESAENLIERGKASHIQKRYNNTTLPVIPLASNEKKLFKSKNVFISILILFIIAGGFELFAAPATKWIFLPTVNHNIAIAQYSPSATSAAKTSIDTYNNAVMQHGGMFGFDAQHTHNNPYEHSVNVTNVSRLHQVWAASTSNFISQSSPAVVNNLVYIGSEDNSLYAFDAATGLQKWAAPTGASIHSSAAVANGIAYIGSTDGKLYAFDALSGLQKWAAPTGNNFCSSAAVANDIVYIDANNNLYAFDAATGRQKWAAPTGNTNFSFSSPAISNGIVYIGSWDGNLYAFDAATGQQKWAAPTGGSWSSPAVANGTVYVGSNDSHLYALDAVTGQQKWATPTGKNIISSPAVANGMVYVGVQDNNLYAFDAATGLQKWTASAGGPVSSSPTIANGLVYVGSDDHNLYAFDALSGQKKWVASTGDGIYSSPTIANGMVYIGSLDHKLYAYSL